MFLRFEHDSFVANKRKISSHLQKLSEVQWLLEVVGNRASNADLLVIGALSSTVQRVSNAAVFGTNLANTKPINVNAVMIITSPTKFLYHPKLPVR